MFPTVPAAAEPLVHAIAQAFTRPTFARFLTLACGLIVTMGRRTVSHALVPIAPLMRGGRGGRGGGHWSGYHRLYSSARFSTWKLAAALVRQVIALLPVGAVIELIADDTVDGKDGVRMWARGSHYDSCRSSRARRDRVKFGHQWLVLCVLVRLPGPARPWALPVLCGLCLSPKVAAQAGARPKTPSELTRQLTMVLMRWLPDRKFVLIGDYKVITHRTACFANRPRRRERLTVVSRLRGDANLYGPPPRRSRHNGRLPAKGRKLPPPADRARRLRPTRQEVAWYGSSRRVVSHVSEAALWYNKHNTPRRATGRAVQTSVTPIRWVCVLGDPGRRQADAFFYSGDAAMTPRRVIELYASRWNIEVTFEEARALLGLETTRHWCRRSVLRVTPILLGLFSAVALIWNRLPATRRNRCRSATPCYRKSSLTFADALFAVRQELWAQCLSAPHHRGRCAAGTPPSLRRLLLWHLTAAA